MKTLLPILLLCCTQLWSQTAPVSLFQSVGETARSAVNLDKHISRYTLLQPDKAAWSSLLTERPASLRISLPFEGGITLELEQSNPFAADFILTASNASGGTDTLDYQPGLHYQGKITGVAHSLVAISIFDDQIMGVISDAVSNINLGRVNTEAARAADMYVMFWEVDLVEPEVFACGTKSPDDLQVPVDVLKPEAALESNLPVNACPVRIFLDCDFGLFLANGSNFSSTYNMAAANFNVVQAIYSNENVGIAISEIHVWTANDPFANGNKDLALGQLKDYYNLNGVNGNLAMLLQPDNIGGVAFLDAFCSNIWNYGVSGNMNYPNPYPNFTYGAQVFAHELGHIMGSQHTQWCGWPGGAIDNCWTTEGGCPPGPPPVNGGTIMSYCPQHPPYGYPLTNGFGPLPGGVIRYGAANGACLKALINTSFCGCIPDQGEIQQLINLYNATNGPNWNNKTNWLNLLNLNWYGVTWKMIGSKCHVKSINLNTNNLTGLLPSLSFQHLESLQLYNNTISGNIPDLSMPELRTLYLFRNKFGGPIPIFQMPLLGDLGLGTNNLTGSIPNFNLPKLTWLTLEENQLSGVIPNFNGMPLLKTLRLSRNLLSGNVPNFNLPNLISFEIEENHLNGTIPNFIFPNLAQNFLISDNEFTGTLPNFDFPLLQYRFDASGNHLTGSIPAFQFPVLKQLYLYDGINNGNTFTGSLPQIIAPEMEDLRLSGNALSGPVPYLNMPKLEWLFLSGNQLTFEGIEQYFPLSINDFSFIEQKKIPVYVSSDCQTLYVKAGGNTSHNVYEWRWYDQLNSWNTITISGDSTFKPSGPFKYSCKVTTTYSPTLYLLSEEIQLGSAYVSITGPTAFCAGGNTILSAGSGYASYSWNTGASIPQITVSTPGNYTVTVSVGPGCTGTAQAVVTTVAYPQPVIQSSNLAICIGSTATLNAGSGYGAYLWSNGKTTQTIDITQPGTYTVTVTNAPACSATASYTLNALPPVNVSISGAAPICPWQSLNLSAGVFASYIWSTGSTAGAITVNQPGTYTVTVTNAAGCTGTATAVVPNYALAVTIQGNLQICIGGLTELDAGAGFSSYSWSNGASTRLNEITQPGIYSVTVTNAQDCTGTISTEVAEVSNPAPKPDIQGLTVVCGSTSTVLDAGPGFAAYRWSTGSTTQNITITQTGFYSVTVSDTGGCKGKDEIMVNFGNIPIPQITGPNALCTGSTGTINVSSGYAAYKWSTGGTSSVLSISQAGIYTVTVTNSAGCTASVSWTVATQGGTINTPPPSGPSTALSGLTATYTVTPVTNAMSYTWTPPPGCSINGNPAGQSVTLPAAIGTNVSVTFGCGYGELCVTAHGNCISNTAACYTLNYLGDSYAGLPICPSFNDAADDCGNACVRLNFENTTFNNGAFTDLGQSFCGNGYLESSMWFSFIAPAANFEMIAGPENCENGDGLQMAIYRSCDDPNPLYCNVGQLGGGNTPLNIAATGMTPGQVYYLMIDTYNHDICDFTIKITPKLSFHLPELPDLPPIQGPSIVCPGEYVTFSIPAVPGAQQYVWDATPAIEINGQNPPVTLDASVGNTVQVIWSNISGGNLNVTAVSSCSAKTRTMNISVKQPQATILPTVIVCYEDAPYTTPWGDDVFTTGTYQTTFSASTGCDSIVKQTVVVKPPIITNLGQKIICEGETVSVCGELFGDNGMYSVICDSYLGCDSNITFSIRALSPVAQIIGNNTICPNGSITLNSAPSPAPTQKRWINGNGQTIGNFEWINITQPGVYVLEALSESGGLTCIKRDTIVVLPSNNQPPSVSAVGGILGCATPTVIIGATSPDQNLTYNWVGPDAFFSDQIFNTVSTAGVYTVIVTNEDGCTASSTATVSVEDKTGTFLLSVNPAQISAVPAAVTDISIPATIHNQEPYPIDMAWERVFINLTPGCESKIEDKISVHPVSISTGAFSLAQGETAPLKIHLTDTDTAACCGVVRLLCRNTCALKDTVTMVYIAGCLVDSKEVPEIEALQILPNPSSGLFTIDGPLPKTDVFIKVFSMDGRLVLNDKLSPKHVFSLMGHASGTYIAVFENQNKLPIKAVELILQAK